MRQNPTSVDKAVAPPAPATPVRNGQQHKRKSPAKFTIWAKNTTRRGVAASRVANNADKHTPCAMDAHDASPVTRAYKEALSKMASGVPMQRTAQGAATA